MQFNFADFYSEASLAPTAETIEKRTAAATRLQASLKKKNILDLTRLYFGLPVADLVWFRDEFARDDPTFSVVNNHREAVILAGAVLRQLLDKPSYHALLSIVSCYFSGHRRPAATPGILSYCIQKIREQSVQDHRPKHIDTSKLKQFTATKAGEEIEAAANDWNIKSVFAKSIMETQSATKEALVPLVDVVRPLALEVRYLREETAMLWWVIGGHSNLLEVPFSSLGKESGLIIAGLELAGLTTVSHLGPIAAPALIDRMTLACKKAKKEESPLSDIIDAFDATTLAKMPINDADDDADITPVLTALRNARNAGPKSWHQMFEKATGLPATVSVSLSSLGRQIYFEHLLGQL